MADLLDQLKRSCAANADATCIVDGSRSITFGDLARRGDAFARELLRRGGAPGDRVAIVSANSIEAAIVYLGIFKAGMTALPINPAQTAREMAFVLSHAQPTAAFVASDRLAVMRAAEAASQGVHRIPVWLTDRAAERETERAAERETERETARETERETDQIAAIGDLAASEPIWPVAPPRMGVLMYTSGTTGHPKGVMIAHDAMLAIARAAGARLALDARDVTTCVLPLFHIYPLVLVYLESLLRGGRLVMLPSFAFPELLRAVSDHGVTVLYAVPPVLQLLAGARWGESDHDLSRLRMIVTGGAPMPVPASRALSDRLGVPVIEGYGTTETASVISIGGPDALTPAGSVGTPLDGVAIRICDASGAALPRGEAGEICVHSPGNMLGYYRDPQTTARALVDGWFRTGDIGRLDEQGFLFITDRLKDVIFVAGEKVYPREVEDQILTFPGIARVAVVRMDYEATGEAPRAYVVPARDMTIQVAELFRHLRDRLSPYKMPKKIDVVDQLPTTASGKVQRFKLLGA